MYINVVFRIEPCGKLDPILEKLPLIKYISFVKVVSGAGMMSGMRVLDSWAGVEIVSKLVSCSPDDWVWPGLIDGPL